MDTAGGRHVSPWVDTMSPPQLGDTTFRQVPADVVVVGAGIVGITTALMLQQAGRSVVVLEAADLSHSVTTHSTVKVTVGHGTLYTAIARTRGLAAAQDYADANTAGFATILRLVQELGIDCMLEHGQPHVVYAETPEGVGAVEDEAGLAHQLGLPVSLTDQAPLPFGVARAVSFASQAQFHPGRYLAGLAEALVAAGGVVVQGVRATGVAERPDHCRVRTTAGTLSARHVVVATQYPFLDRGGHFSQLQARRSYGVAGVLPEGTGAGMTINVGSPTRSTRSVTLGGEELLVVVGEGHEVGHETDTAQRWTRLQDWAGQRFGVTDFRYHWSAQEISSLDHVPFVGRISPLSRRVLTATGFAGWGMTNGTAAAAMLRDLVLGRDNPWLATFDARRAQTSVPPVKEFVRHNLHVARTWLTDRVGGSPPGAAHELQPGEAAVLAVGGEKVAAHRDEDGRLHAVSAVCTHLRCTVEWNAGESSWDCPCHGSRFSLDGQVLHGPASTPLAKREVD